MINNLFSIPIWKNTLNIDNDIKENLLDQIIQNYEKHENYIHPYWNCAIHTTHKDYNDINYSNIIQVYKQEYENFVSENNLNLNFHNYHINRPWYNYYIKHSNQELHDHTGFDINNKKFAMFSAVHFLKLHKDHPKIVLYNPSLAHMIYTTTNFFKDNSNHSFFKKYFVLDVKEGDLIIFPSCLEHAVFQQTIDDPRITISFNIMADWE
jgi:uncharacterized protein (TIGR02466 family)